MADYLTGSYRSATFGTTISNFAGGIGAIRVFNVYLKGTTITNSNLTFYNGASSASTANAYLVVSLDSTNPTSTYFDSHVGILFPGGCFITTSAAIDFGVVGYRAETL